MSYWAKRQQRVLLGVALLPVFSLIGWAGTRAGTIGQGLPDVPLSSVSFALGSNQQPAECMDHDKGVLDSALSADLTDVAEEMDRLAIRAKDLWLPEEWTPRHPPFDGGKQEDFYLGAASVARLAVSLDLTNLRARFLLSSLEWHLSIWGEGEYDKERAELARKHTACALHLAQVAGDSIAIRQSAWRLRNIDSLLEQMR